jgi:hypothetical protein
MKRLVAAVSFAVLAAPVFAQPQGLGPTSPIGPSWVFGFNAAPLNSQVASTGATRSDTEIGTEAGLEAEYHSRHVEEQPGYFDPSR